MHPAAVRSISSTALLVLLSLSGWKRSRHKQPVPRTARNASITPEERYVPLRRDPRLFTSLLRDEWITSEARAVAAAAWEGYLHEAVVRESAGVYSFELFSKTFCETFLREVDNYDASGLPVRRPNSMNNYGLIVNEIGMRDAITELQQDILWPVARLLWPLQSTQFDAHHSFIVRYKADEDPGLDMHTDDSDVTFNACLNSNFTGAGLTFCGDAGTSRHRKLAFRYRHEMGRVVIHLGTKRHGADDIESGERRNLIIWNHNHRWRASRTYRRRRERYATEAGEPDTECVSYTHDRDYGAFKPHTDKTREHANRPWCPPEQACYDTMGERLLEDEYSYYGGRPRRRSQGMCPAT
jgi:hypothetical protein